MRSIIKLSPHLCLGLHSCISPSGLPKKTQYTFFFASMHAAWPTHLVFLGLFMLITIITLNDSNVSWNHNLNDYNSPILRLPLLVQYFHQDLLLLLPFKEQEFIPAIQILRGNASIFKWQMISKQTLINIIFLWSYSGSAVHFRKVHTSFASWLA